jgi:N6-L-threonylcarbamoyladenine synthase
MIHDGKNIYILGIETSCDDTCAAVVWNGERILSNVITSQNEIHAKYGGVVPELASRRHIEVIDLIIKEAIARSEVSIDRINAVSVTNRPGLVGSLLVGVGAAKAISYAKSIPLIAVNHLKAHLYSNILDNPGMGGGFIGLIVSGGHSSLYLVDRNWNIMRLGQTVDDAAGEAFDKIARFLNLGYPGGPIIDKLSKDGDPTRIVFPKPMLESKDLNFSFSGLKTALIYKMKKEPSIITKENIKNLVAGFQESIVEVLVEKTINAAKKFKYKKILVSGGVAANSRLREYFQQRTAEEAIDLFIPPISLCMDNAAMVACIGYYEYVAGDFSKLDVDVYSKSDI